MPCEYESISAFGEFTDRATLDKALIRVGQRGYLVEGLRVEAMDGPVAMNRLKQAYQVEAAKITAKKKGFFVTETTNPDGRIVLRIRR
jgi:hypothetical protein